MGNTFETYSYICTPIIRVSFKVGQNIFTKKENRMKQFFEFRDFANLTSALDSYQRTATILPQLTMEEPYRERLRELCSEEPYYKSSLIQNWADIDVHIVQEMWGSTSCGWGGMGGSAMTNSYSIIVFNRRNNLAFIYWDGILAYIIKAEDMKPNERGVFRTCGLWELSKENIVPYYVNKKRNRI